MKTVPFGQFPIEHSPWESAVIYTDDTSRVQRSWEAVRVASMLDILARFVYKLILNVLAVTVLLFVVRTAMGIVHIRHNQRQ